MANVTAGTTTSRESAAARDFFERIVGPQDLYGFLTSRNSVKDLVLGQKTRVTVRAGAGPLARQDRRSRRCG
jgi:hypothetical protein